jgi:hypothetical protein
VSQLFFNKRAFEKAIKYNLIYKKKSYYFAILLEVAGVCVFKAKQE